MMKKVQLTQLQEYKARWLIFCQGKLLVETGAATLPHKHWSELSFLHHYHAEVRQLEPLENQWFEVPHYILDLGFEQCETAGWEPVSLRSAISEASMADFAVIARAWQYVHFLRTHQFCGRCGSRMEQIEWEMATQCYQCQHRCYPRVSPCIIVAIARPGQILLAKGTRHQSTNMYSTLAGFVESGESLEQAVHREVFEEVGVKIHNLRYFGSQPWPFPHSLMMGYIADYHSGDIRIDEREIVDAQWFNLDQLPNIPPKLSIAGQLIEEVVKGK